MKKRIRKVKPENPAFAWSSQYAFSLELVRRCLRPAPLTGGCCAQVSQEGFGNKANCSDRSSLRLLRVSHFLVQMLQMAADLCLIFGFSLELIWAVFLAGFVIFVEEQQITLFLDNLIVSLKIIYTVFSAEVEPRAWYMLEKSYNSQSPYYFYISKPTISENISFYIKEKCWVAG